MSDVKQYYDAYSTEQQQTGINKRHKSIRNWLLKFGVNKSDSVLEIGCGIGTFTALLADTLPNGSITALDISSKSIEIAKGRLSQKKNISFVAGDVIAETIKGSFDIIILPDVLEHIPLQQHPELFRKLSSLLKKTGYILVHIPNPYYLEWCRENTPELLQIIDQPIYTDVLTSAVYPAGLYIHHLQTYSVWIDNCDYQVIQIRHNIKKDYAEIPFVKKPLHKRLINKLKSIF